MRAEERVWREAIECVFVFECEASIDGKRGARKKTLEVLDCVTAQGK